jgi:asparagine synthase (glutamine-hydrolysing)
MCGIAGIWAPDLDQRQILAELDVAVARLNHRGPDDRGVWTDGAGLALGHARLSILELSPLGHQPMVSADGNHAIVFNGEIYNFMEIRQELIALGHAFRGCSDTEVVLEAFREWGTAAVQKFIGMFAIAYWDGATRTLELLRDRVG